MGFTISNSRIISPFLSVLAFACAAFAAAPVPNARIVIEQKGTLGVIRGVVRDEGGGPISDATVAIFRAGTSRLLKQVSSGTDGSFVAKIIPGTYTVLAVAQGFNPITLFGIEVARSADLTYGFKLERSGNGNTLPEHRLDRNSSKWRIRAAQSQRSIYQNRDGADPLNKAVVEDETAEAEPETGNNGKGQSVVETYFASAKDGNYAGVNIATFQPVSSKTDCRWSSKRGKAVMPLSVLPPGSSTGRMMLIS